MIRLHAIRLPITGEARRIVLFEDDGDKMLRRVILNEDDLWPREPEKETESPR